MTIRKFILVTLMPTLLLLGTVGLISAETTAPKTLYVSTTGSDMSGIFTNSCQSQNNPCRTIEHAADVAVTGDTISINQGEYTEALSLNKSLNLIGTGGVPVIKAPFNKRVLALSGAQPFLSFTLQNLQLRDGSPPSIGGCILALDSVVALTLTDVTLLDCDSIGAGGGLHFSGQRLTLNNVDVIDNFASQDGGGIWTSDDVSEIVITGSNIEDNRSGSDGGGLYVMGDSFVMTGTTVALNQSDSDGGGMVLNQVAAATIEQSSINLNNTRIRGGGIESTESNLRIANSNIVLNVVTADDFGEANGGGINTSFGGTLTLDTVALRSNQAPNFGGGVAIDATTVATVTHSTFALNQADSGGGGINNRGTLEVQFSTLEENEAGAAGGGILNAVAGDLRVWNSTLSANQATNSGGNLLNVGSSLVDLSTIAFGSAEFGGNVHNAAGDLTVSLSILANARMGIDCFNEAVFEDDGDGSLIADGSCPTNNQADPRLLPLADNGGPTRTHALGAGSPAIDQSQALSCFTLDQRGINRFVDGDGSGSGACDLGAYEYDGEPTPIFFTRFVTSDGSDNFNDCLTAATPCRSVEWAVTRSITGDEISIGVGTYNQTMNFGKSLRFFGPADGPRPILQAPANERVFTLIGPNRNAGGNVMAVELENLVVRDGDGVGAGGCIYADNSVASLALTNVRVVNCQTDLHGGGIFFSGDALSLSDVEIDSNTALLAFGGGMYVDTATVVISSTLIHDNNAETGGGFWANESDVMLSNSTVLANSVTASGGGIAGNDLRLTMQSSQLLSNSAEFMAGGLYLTVGSTATIKTSRFADNDAYSGGAIGVSFSSIVVNDTTVEGNRAPTFGSNGGGIAIINGQVTLDRVLLTRNYGGLDGGGVYADEGSSLQIDDSIIIANSARNGGGLFNRGQAEVNNTLIGRNVMRASGGGVSNTGTLLVTSSELEANHPLDLLGNFPELTKGGGIHNLGGSVTVVDSSIVSNHAQFGGGIHNDQGDLTVRRTTVRNNRADSGVGIISLGSAEFPATANISQSAIYNHSESYDDPSALPSQGGGIFNGADSTVIISNTTVSNNQVTSNGGNLYNFDVMELAWTTVANGSAAIGGNIYNQAGGRLRYEASIVADAVAGGDCVNDGDLFLNNVLRSLIEDDSDCPAALSGDPVLGALVDNGGPTLTHLLAISSPALNSNIVLTKCPASDQRGYSRPDMVNNACDLGAFELAGSPLAVGLDRVQVSAETPIATVALFATLVLVTVGSFRRGTIRPIHPDCSSGM